MQLSLIWRIVYSTYIAVPFKYPCTMIQTVFVVYRVQPVSGKISSVTQLQSQEVASMDVNTEGICILCVYACVRAWVAVCVCVCVCMCSCMGGCVCVCVVCVFL